MYHLQHIACNTILLNLQIINGEKIETDLEMTQMLHLGHEDFKTCIIGGSGGSSQVSEGNLTGRRN